MAPPSVAPPPADALSLERERRFVEGAKEASRFFMDRSDVHGALERLVTRLEALGVPYAIVGALALNAYGYQRTTSDVDVLVRREDWDRFKARHLGRGYLEKFPGSRGVRDTERKVEIDVVIAGEYPGDGQPKAVAFPDPAEAAAKGERFALLPLEKLIELKLASGTSAPHRLRDLADVLELIRINDLPEDLGRSLDASVREKYAELWRAARSAEDDPLG